MKKCAPREIKEYSQVVVEYYHNKIRELEPGVSEACLSSPEYWLGGYPIHQTRQKQAGSICAPLQQDTTYMPRPQGQPYAYGQSHCPPGRCQGYGYRGMPGSFDGSWRQKRSPGPMGMMPTGMVGAMEKMFNRMFN